MTVRIRLVVLTLLLVATGVVVGGAGAGKGGPSPGVQLEGRGIAKADGALRYATRSLVGSTRVTAFDADGGAARTTTVQGILGIPFVAFDGALGGLAHDGRSLVLAAPDVTAGKSRFVVLSTTTLALRREIALRGTWSFDALSPDGRKLYLVEHAVKRSPTYRVRVYDVGRGALVREAVIDPRQGGRAMTGMPVTRATDARGVWAYTLYQKPGGLPFVHALDTVRGKALCIELPWRGDQGRLFDVRMRVEGRELVLTRLGRSHLATIDTRAFVVHAHDNPLRKTATR